VRWVAQRDPVGAVFGGHDGSGVWSSIEELTGLWQRAAMAVMRETRVIDLACDGLDGCDAQIWPDWEVTAGRGLVLSKRSRRGTC
jgi:hypothetical protein